MSKMIFSALLPLCVQSVLLPTSHLYKAQTSSVLTEPFLTPHCKLPARGAAGRAESKTWLLEGTERRELPSIAEMLR